MKNLKRTCSPSPSGLVVFVLRSIESTHERNLKSKHSLIVLHIGARRAECSLRKRRDWYHNVTFPPYSWFIVSLWWFPIDLVPFLPFTSVTGSYGLFATPLRYETSLVLIASKRTCRRFHPVVRADRHVIPPSVSSWDVLHDTICRPT